jgi:hypothetical protein
VHGHGFDYNRLSLTCLSVAQVLNLAMIILSGENSLAIIAYMWMMPYITPYHSAYDLEISHGRNKEVSKIQVYDC